MLADIVLIMHQDHIQFIEHIRSTDLTQFTDLIRFINNLTHMDILLRVLELEFIGDLLYKFVPFRYNSQKEVRKTKEENENVAFYC